MYRSSIMYRASPFGENRPRWFRQPQGQHSSCSRSGCMSTGGWGQHQRDGPGGDGDDAHSHHQAHPVKIPAGDASGGPRRVEGAVQQADRNVRL